MRSPRLNILAAGLTLSVLVGMFEGFDAAAQDLSALPYAAPAEQRAPRRVGGNSRGALPSLPWVAALAPDHLALTVSEQPALYWYLSAPTTARIEITLIVPGRAAPLVETVAAGDRAGIHAFWPGRFGVRLEPGVQYEWSVAVVADPAQRSLDVFTGAALMRVPISGALAASLAKSGPAARARAYAEAGVWYDAFDALTADIEAQPGNLALRERRTASIESIGLAEAAAMERRK